MISPRTPLHKSGAATAALLLMVMAGCGGDGGSAREEAAPAPEASGSAITVTVDAGGWTAFTALAGRIAAGEQVPRPEMGGLGADPAWERWRATRTEEVDLRRTANWVEATFWTELGRQGTRKTHPLRERYVESWRWSWAHRDLVDTRVSETADDAAELSALLERWISPANRPARILVTILPTLPEFRLVGDEYFVDTGFLAATPRDRLMGELAGLMFRDREFIPGEDYRAAVGAAALAHTLRSCRNQGLAHWLEDTPHAIFYNDHPSFSESDVITQKYWEHALRALDILERELPALWTEPGRLESRGAAVMHALNTLQADRKLGWAMAAVIAANLGEDRLREAGRTVPGFFAAFQEAAALNPRPAPDLADCVGAYHRAMPPLGDEAWSGLPDLLAEFFPE